MNVHKKVDKSWHQSQSGARIFFFACGRQWTQTGHSESRFFLFSSHPAIHLPAHGKPFVNPCQPLTRSPICPTQLVCLPPSSTKVRGVSSPENKVCPKAPTANADKVSLAEMRERLHCHAGTRMQMKNQPNVSNAP